MQTFGDESLMFLEHQLPKVLFSFVEREEGRFQKQRRCLRCLEFVRRCHCDDSMVVLPVDEPDAAKDAQAVRAQAEVHHTAL